jgi:hypothetical protein
MGALRLRSEEKLSKVLSRHFSVVEFLITDRRWGPKNQYRHKKGQKGAQGEKIHKTSVLPIW